MCAYVYVYMYIYVYIRREYVGRRGEREEGRPVLSPPLLATFDFEEDA